MSENQSLKHQLLLLNGPNMNLLGRRDPTQYGHWTLADVENETRKAALSRGYGLDAVQSNYEGKLVDLIQEASQHYDGILLNAAALTHYSFAIRDAIDACGIPVMEVHMSDIRKREPFRRISVIEPACQAQISGLGLNSYLVALEQLCDLLEGKPTQQAGEPAVRGRTTDLESLRGQLSELDEALLNHFFSRIGIVRQVAAYKHQTGLPVLDMDREAIVAAWARNRYPASDGIRAESLVRTIMRLSREAQYDDIEPEDKDWAVGSLVRNAPSTVEQAARVVCQGAPGAYSMAAGARLFPKAALISAPTFADACALVTTGQADLAVLPLENSTAGTVDDVYDLLQANRLYIIQSASLPISHCLMAAPGTRLEAVRTVVSHPQALAQCQLFIRQHGWKTQESTNTAHAAAEVAAAADPTLAAIASAEAARIHGLQIFSDDICDSGHNQTRFVVISRTLVIPQDADRVSLILSLPHQTGSLASTLSMFSDRGINLLKIQSRPDPQKAWNYRFYLDFESPRHAREALLVLYQLDREMPYLQLLGWYRESDRPEFA